MLIPTKPPEPSVATTQRKSQRFFVPVGIVATLNPTAAEASVVTLRDVSRTGACVVRASRLPIEPGAMARLDVRNNQTGAAMSARVVVRWVRYGGMNTYVGLQFVPGPLRPGTMLEPYLSGVPAAD